MSTSVEAEIVLPPPTPVLTHTTRTPPSERDPLDSFFGYTFSASRTYESRYVAEALPAYIEDHPPTYARKAPEPLTLARYLFKFGFLFPPFWIMGAWILFSPLRIPSDVTDPEGQWMAEKSEIERQHILDRMRSAEIRWARRCLWAIIVFILVAVAGIAAWAVTRS
ncbi:hypothetical protein H0H81_002707 [Sphagnurus paluster]|uniref:Transmembrane protein n=1 Tax=Sphagnurus paluster TaxID=117069 RepID=A0A9P7GND2_9AGAR|nr:hypothetical protein H0H81_002707 [Sphagnurus paluster]